MTDLRRMQADDLVAVDLMAWTALSDMAARYEDGPFPERSAVGIERSRRRIAHLQRTDPLGAWVAVDGAEVIGVALALRRGPLWFLSLLAVATRHQAQGVGRGLLDASMQTAAGAGAAWILATADPKALRRYAMAGFAPHPGYTAKGPLDRACVPATAVRAGDWAVDATLVDDVVTSLRGAPYGVDVEAMAALDLTLVVVDEPAGRGFGAYGPRGISAVGATTPDIAQRLLWAAMAETASPVATVDWLTADQQWAIDVVLAARLPLLAGPSSCRRGSLGPLTPYLPSGAFG